MKTIEITYNGFHGRRYFHIRPIEIEAAFENLTNPEIQTGYYVTVSKAVANRINRVVGCKTHNVIFGVSYPIQGACKCGEGVEDITCKDYDNLIDITFRTDNEFVVRGKYPQN